MKYLIILIFLLASFTSPAQVKVEKVLVLVSKCDTCVARPMKFLHYRHDNYFLEGVNRQDLRTLKGNKVPNEWILWPMRVIYLH